MKATRHFRESEFTCTHCNLGTVDQHVVAILELVRHHFNKRVFITSPYRCPSHNAAVGGVVNSYHTKQMACDFCVEDVSPEDVYSFLNSVFPNCYGMGLYATKGFVHLDVREERARWKK